MIENPYFPFCERNLETETNFSFFWKNYERNLETESNVHLWDLSTQEIKGNFNVDQIPIIYLNINLLKICLLPLCFGSHTTTNFSEKKRETMEMKNSTSIKIITKEPFNASKTHDGVKRASSWVKSSVLWKRLIRFGIFSDERER